MTDLYPDADQSLALQADEIHAILLLIEQTRPEEIVHPDQLARIGPYSFAQARVAIAQQTLSCTDAERVYARTSEKCLVDGRKVSLIAAYPFLQAQQGLPGQITIKVNNGTYRVLEFVFPILEPSSEIAVFIRFDDFRSNPPVHTSLYGMQQGATVQQIRHMWSGLRFLCRNIRQWAHPGITWPEEI